MKKFWTVEYQIKGKWDIYQTIIESSARDKGLEMLATLQTNCQRSSHELSRIVSLNSVVRSLVSN